MMITADKVRELAARGEGTSLESRSWTTTGRARAPPTPNLQRPDGDGEHAEAKLAAGVRPGRCEDDGRRPATWRHQPGVEPHFSARGVIPLWKGRARLGQRRPESVVPLGAPRQVSIQRPLRPTFSTTRVASTRSGPAPVLVFSRHSRIIVGDASSVELLFLYATTCRRSDIVESQSEKNGRPPQRISYTPTDIPSTSRKLHEKMGVRFRRLLTFW
ncbi:MAG: hypothetical protein ACTHU0_21180 [Kofleriaceae bacterium]